MTSLCDVTAVNKHVTALSSSFSTSPYSTGTRSTRLSEISRGWVNEREAFICVRVCGGGGGCEALGMIINWSAGGGVKLTRVHNKKVSTRFKNIPFKNISFKTIFSKTCK